MRVLAVFSILILPALAGCLGDPKVDSNDTSNTSVTGDGGAENSTFAWSVTDTEGESWSNTSLEGQPSLLFFMATWCSTCKSKTGALSSLHHEFGDDVQFLSVSFDPSESDKALNGWKTDYDQHWPHGVDRTGGASNTYRVTIQSWIVVLDANGDVLLNKYNPNEATMRDALERATASAAAA